MLVDVNRPYAVQSQEHQVHKVFMRKRFRTQMSMHQPEAAKTPPAATAFGKIGYIEGAGATYEYRFDAAVTGYEQSYLASGFK